ncbi:hypothetical protein DM860_011234 [Cuscuta australis]|uniref:Retrotransposon gag domain-containing protein n=1 Tax=Cuscuta australis TaxID=267555 RepID=A0A328DPX6_9ASTE|nr:hypothetical protein DM860_011234 [Cuscuta australis]
MSSSQQINATSAQVQVGVDTVRFRDGSGSGTAGSGTATPWYRYRYWTGRYRFRYRRFRYRFRQPTSHPGLWPGHGHVPKEWGDALSPWYVPVRSSRRGNHAPTNSNGGDVVLDADAAAITFPAAAVESDDGEWDIPRAHKKKGKTIRPVTSRNSAFERLGDREEGQKKSAKQRLGQSVAHVSAFARLGEVREAEPARTRRSRSNRQEPARTRASRQEEEAESQPRLPVANRLTIPNDRVQQMEAKLERLEKKVGEKNDRDKPLAGSPFTTRVHLTPFPRKVKIDAPGFTGKEDPEIHLDSFNQSATMNGCTDEEKCLLFFQTLRNRATEWFNKLRPGSIDSFSDLASKFKAKFQENCTKRKKFTYLSTAGQRESENLTQFLTRWKEEVDKVEEMDDKTVLSLLLNGPHAGELYKEFCRKPLATDQEAYHTAWEFAEGETQLRAKREAEHGFKPKPVQVKKEETPGSSRPRHHYDPVIRMVNTEECQEIRKAPVIPPENPTGQTGRQWSGTYCSYHRSDSHNTSECKSVKGVIRQMIDSGELGKDYLQKAQEKSHQWAVDRLDHGVEPTGQTVLIEEFTRNTKVSKSQSKAQPVHSSSTGLDLAYSKQAKKAKIEV